MEILRVLRIVQMYSFRAGESWVSLDTFMVELFMIKPTSNPTKSISKLFPRGRLHDQAFRDFMNFIEKLVVDIKDKDDMAWAGMAVRDLGEHPQKGLRVARTAGNENANVPPEARPGDQIVVLVGHNRPSLVCKVRRGHVYVGPVAFSEALIDKSIDRSTASKDEPKIICLR